MSTRSHLGREGEAAVKRGFAQLALYSLCVAGRSAPLTHALVPLVVLHVALGAAAAEAPHHVLAAVLAAVITATLVHI